MLILFSDRNSTISIIAKIAFNNSMSYSQFCTLMHVFSYYYNNLSQGKNRLSSCSWKCALVRDSSSHFVYTSNLIKILEGKGKHSYSCWGPRHVYHIQGNNGLENSYWPIRISQVVMAKYCRSAAGTNVIHSRADPGGVWMNPPGHLRLHIIICAYLAWSSNDFWLAEPLHDENTS